MGFKLQREFTFAEHAQRLTMLGWLLDRHDLAAIWTLDWEMVAIGRQRWILPHVLLHLLIRDMDDAGMECHMLCTAKERMEDLQCLEALDDHPEHIVDDELRQLCWYKRLCAKSEDVVHIQSIESVLLPRRHRGWEHVLKHHPLQGIL
jgi:hypothetical protein